MFNPLRNWRDSLAARLEIIWEFTVLVFCLSGATLASVVGKFLLAAVLAAIALGILLRMTRRGRRRQPPES